MKIVGLLMLVAAMALSVRGEPAAGTDAATHGAFLHGRYEFELRRALAEYQKSPRRVVAQDAAAQQFLTGCIQRWNEQPGVPAVVELERAGRLLYLEGCDDPLVMSFYGRLLVRFVDWTPGAGWNVMPAQPSNDLAVAEPFLSPDELLKRGYDAAFAADAMRALREVLSSDDDRNAAKRRDAAMVGAIVRAAGDASFGKDARAFLVHDVGAWSSGFSTDLFKRLADGLDASPNVDEVVKCLVRGVYHRGMSLEGREGAEHLAEARRLLTRAWELDPSLPDAPVAMIALSRNPADRAECRQWFDRAIKPRLDGPEIYATYFDSLRNQYDAKQAPDAIYAVGLEAARAGRFDTEAPRQLLRAMDVILSMSDGEYETWERFKPWPEVKRAYEGYLAEPTRAWQADRNRSAFAAYAARLGQYATARSLLDGLADRLDADSIAEARYKPHELLGEVHVHSGALAERTAQAERFAAAGRFKEATEVYDAELKAPGTSAAAQRYLRGRAQLARWQQSLDAGEWIDLAADGDLSGFAAESGDWTAEPDGALTLRVNSTESKIIALVDLGEHWEVSCDVAFLDAQDRQSNAAVLMLPRQRGYWHSVQLLNNLGKVYAGSTYFFDRAAIDMKLERFTKLDVRQQAGRVSVTVNGREVITQKPLDHYGEYGRERLGFGAQSWKTGDVIRFERIRVRKLAA